MKLAVLVLVLAAAIGVGILAYNGGEDENCYPPVDSGQPESAEEHGLVSEECK